MNKNTFETYISNNNILIKEVHKAVITIKSNIKVLLQIITHFIFFVVNDYLF